MRRRRERLAPEKLAGHRAEPDRGSQIGAAAAGNEDAQLDDGGTGGSSLAVATRTAAITRQAAAMRMVSTGGGSRK